MRRAQTTIAIAAVALAACREFTTQRPGFVVEPPVLAFTARAGGRHPPLQFLTMFEITSRPGRWTGTADVPWIDLLSVGDSLPFYLGVGVGTEFAAGVYRGSITVQRPDFGDARVIPVTLTLTATTPLDGRWVGVRDTVMVTLTLADSTGGVTGTGMLEPRDRSVVVTGTYTYPSLALRLVSGTDTTALTGSFVDDNTVAATLNGGGFTSFAVTLNRQ